MNLTITQNNYSKNQNPAFTSFSPEISKFLDKVTPYQRKVAISTTGLTEKMYKTVQDSESELKLDSISNNIDSLKIGDFDTGIELEKSDDLDADMLFAGIRRSYNIIKTYIEPGKKIFAEKESKIAAIKQKLEDEILEAKTNALGSYIIDNKENDLKVINNIIRDDKEVPKSVRNLVYQGVSKRKYKTTLNNTYKEMYKNHRTEFSEYKTSAFRQNLDDKIGNIKHWFKRHFKSKN